MHLQQQEEERQPTVMAPNGTPGNLVWLGTTVAIFGHHPYPPSHHGSFEPAHAYLYDQMFTGFEKKGIHRSKR